MTAFGVALVDPDNVIAWADSELYQDGRGAPSAFAPKLTVNPLISAVASGCGRRSVTSQANAIVAGCADFDALPKLVSTALQRAVASIGSYFSQYPDEFDRQHYAFAGWSKSAGRMLGYSFSANSFFAPQLAGLFMSPNLDVPLCWRPRDGGEVMETARGQMRELRAGRCSGAGVGALTIAHVQPGTIHLQTIENFDNAAYHLADMEV